MDIISAYEAGDYATAFNLGCQAVIDGCDDRDKINFIVLSHGVSVIQFDPLIKQAILKCLQDSKLEHQELFEIWKGILYLDPAMQPLFWHEWEKLPLDPFLIEGIRVFILSDPLLEKCLTKFRKWLCLNQDQLNDSHYPLLTALAENCFMNEYAWQQTEEEIKLISAATPIQACLYACYKPLPKGQYPKEMGEIVRLQIDEPEEEKKIEIKSLSEIKGVSKKVREQYEENPYPRWRTETIASQFPDKGRFLIAGCGTGKSSMPAANCFPNVDIVAIDLSLSSLRYARRRTKHSTNIEFYQCDILDVDKIEGKFDVIECGGVLHHMEDPLEGWRRLSKKLAPNGAMFIGLYSKHVRRNIIKAQEYARQFARDIDGIRALRGELLKEDNPHHIIAQHQTDFYTTSRCRDLLMHVQEINLTLPEISRMLDILGLQFGGFRLNPKARALFLQEHDDPLDLNQWDEFERKNPDFFNGVYAFACGGRNDLFDRMCGEFFTK